MRYTEENREALYDAIIKQEEGILEFRSYFARYGGQNKLKITPVKDKATGWYKGVERISNKLKESGEAYVDPYNKKDSGHSFMIIDHKMQLDLSDPIVKLKLKWALHCPALDLAFDPTNKNKESFFYIYDKVQDRKRKFNNIEVKKQAFKLLDNITDAEYGMLGRLIGLDLAPLTAEEQKLKMLEYVDESPAQAKKVIDAYADKNKEVKNFLINAVNKGVIKETEGGHYKFGEDFIIATSFDSAVTWIREAGKNKKSSDYQVLTAIKDQIDKLK